MIDSVLGMSPGWVEGDSAVAVASKLEPAIVFGCIWSFGAALQVKDGVDYRKMFDEHWRSEHGSDVKIPSRETVYEYYLDASTARFDVW